MAGPGTLIHLTKAAAVAKSLALPAGIYPGHLLPRSLINSLGELLRASAQPAFLGRLGELHLLFHQVSHPGAAHWTKCQKKRQAVWALLPPAVWSRGLLLPPLSFCLLTWPWWDYSALLSSWDFCRITWLPWALWPQPLVLSSLLILFQTNVCSWPQAFAPAVPSTSVLWSLLLPNSGSVQMNLLRECRL